MTLPDFSEREKEVAELLLQGKSNKQIAQALGIATRTVEFHASHIYEKLGAASRAEAIVLLSQAYLRESAGVLRHSTVENGARKTENGESLKFDFRRITMRTLLIVLAATAALALVCLAAVLVLSPQFNQAAIFSATVPAATYTPTEPTHTAVQPTYTPYEPTRTAMQPTPTPYDRFETNVITTLSPLLSTNGRWTYEGVLFAQDAALASSASGQLIAAKAAGPDGPWWEVYPQHVRIALEGYPVPGTFHSPQINVYLVEEYRAASPYAAEMLDLLNETLARQPGGEEQLPFLPLINAQQSFRAGVQYLDFQNGSGLRYLTIYAQYPAPVNNEDLFYTFQGLTHDGRHLVSIVMPIQHPALLPNADLTQAEFEAIVQDYDNHRATYAATLEAQPPASFTPALDQLDALVQSLEIDR